MIELDLGAAGDSLLSWPWPRFSSRAFGCIVFPQPLRLTYRGPNRIAVRRRLRKGEELGYFEHGSTIIVFGSEGFVFAAAPEGQRDRDGASRCSRQL